MGSIKRISLVLLIVFIVLVAISTTPMQSEASSHLFVQITPAQLQQGRMAVIRVFAPTDVTRMEAVFQGQRIPFYRSVDGDWVGLLASDIYGDRGVFSVDVVSWAGETFSPAQPATLEIVWGSFPFQNINVANSLLPLLDPELNRQEFEQLQRIYSRYTPVKMWEGPLWQPVIGEQISEFGGIRDYNNGTLESLHTGVDFRAALNDPVMAVGNGRVVFAQPTPIHGNHVVIDHGIGVLSGYSHLNEINVVPGQRVLAGEVIGTVGATGRVEGAHFHFELTVNGYWIDPTQFMQLIIPEDATSDFTRN
ncbi:MAG: M23 family metallopeptidase [Anaerolineae bacterium]|nr:M23 family metallopeptidase [Anaerolineae bacterium]